jgi:chaperonin GroEL
MMNFRPPGIPDNAKKHPLPRARKPTVVLQPNTYRSLQRGINTIAEAIRPTLGPLPRLVLMEGLRRHDRPELLDNAAIIARRIVEIEPRGSDVGAMLIRQALWKMHMEAGDGGATMAVMYQTILNEGVRYLTQARANAMLLRGGLETGLDALLAAIGRDAVPLTGKPAIAAMARGMCQNDDEMADLLGEIFDIVGPDGLIIIEKWNRPGLEREYIDGTYWHLSGWWSRFLVTEPGSKRTLFEDAALLITDLKLTQPEQLVPVLDRCLQAGIKRLVIVAAEVSDSVVGLLVKNNSAKTIETLAVRTPRVGEAERVAAMEDIALLSGGRAFYSGANEQLADFQVSDLGRVRRAWATESLFGIYGGKGDARKLRQHVVQLRGQLRLAELDHDRRELQQRIGRASGGTVIMRVGGYTDAEVEQRTGIAEQAVKALRKSVNGGVVPGGGAALLAARDALKGLPVVHDEQRAAYRILARALEEPMRTIARNAGAQPDIIIEKVKECPVGFGYDARARQIVDTRQAGILDSAMVLKTALEIAVRSAALVLTTDVIVHHKQPKESLEP